MPYGDPPPCAVAHYHPTTFSPIDAMTRMGFAAQCEAGFHAWMPWLQLADAGGAVHFETYCVRCRRRERYDP